MFQYVHYVQHVKTKADSVDQVEIFNKFLRIMNKIKLFEALKLNIF